MCSAQNQQVMKWCFTYNNFELNFDYESHFKKSEFKIRRCVYGREVAPTTGTVHLQGYLECFRSVRLSHVRKILRSAFWVSAKGTSLQNYAYCTKSGDFTTVGDFSAEERGNQPDDNNRRQPASTSLIIRGLLDPNCSLQVKASKEYAERSSYYDRISLFIKDLQDKHVLHNEWKSKLLYQWQFQVIEMLMQQDARKILWVVDTDGNRGKTFLCLYLSILYKYQYLDGMINCRDLASLVDKTAKGVVFDVSRCSHTNFDYSALESLKNGILISGKYKGQFRIFDSSLKIAVFSNSFPFNDRLSKDRWQIINLDDVEKIIGQPTVFPGRVYPFEALPSIPELSDDFDLRVFLEARVSEHSVEVDHVDSTIDVPLATQALAPTLQRSQSLNAIIPQESTSAVELQQSTSLPLGSIVEESDARDASQVIIGSVYCQNDGGGYNRQPIYGAIKDSEKAKKTDDPTKVKGYTKISERVCTASASNKYSPGKSTTLDGWLLPGIKRKIEKVADLKSVERKKERLEIESQESDAVSSSDELIESSQRAIQEPEEVNSMHSTISRRKSGFAPESFSENVFPEEEEDDGISEADALLFENLY